MLSCWYSYCIISPLTSPLASSSDDRCAYWTLSTNQTACRLFHRRHAGIALEHWLCLKDAVLKGAEDQEIGQLIVPYLRSPLSTAHWLHDQQPCDTQHEENDGQPVHHPQHLKCPVVGRGHKGDASHSLTDSQRCKSITVFSRAQYAVTAFTVAHTESLCVTLSLQLKHAQEQYYIHFE